jgi:hypothetical protein
MLSRMADGVTLITLWINGDFSVQGRGQPPQKQKPPEGGSWGQGRDCDLVISLPKAQALSP